MLLELLLMELLVLTIMIKRDFYLNYLEDGVPDVWDEVTIKVVDDVLDDWNFFNEW